MSREFVRMTKHLVVSLDTPTPPASRHDTIEMRLTAIVFGARRTNLFEFRSLHGGNVPEFAAGVCFYGIPPKEFADPAKIKVPFQGHFANQDDWCTPAAVDGLESAMKAAGTAPEIYRYDAAHAFFNERSAAYDLASANQSWERTASFLEKRL